MYGCTRLALDRPRPDERDLHRQVVEVLGPRAQEALHLRAALDLEVADRVGAPGSRRRRPASSSGMRERSIGSPCSRARSARRSPRPPRASRARAGRSSGSRRRRRSPCPTGRAAGPAIAAGCTGTSSTSGRVEITIPPGCWEMWRGRPRDLAPSARANARQRGETSLRSRVRQLRELLGDPLRVPAVGEPREPLELGERQPERLADVADRAARAVGREARDERGVLAPVALGDARRSASRGCRAGSRGRCRAPRSSSSVEEAAEREARASTGSTCESPVR